GDAAPVGARARRAADAPPGPAPWAEGGGRLAGLAAVHGGAGRAGDTLELLERDEVVERVRVGRRSLTHHDADEAQDRRPVGRTVAGRREDRRRVVGVVANRELPQRQVVVRRLERRETWQDDVRVP